MNDFIAMPLTDPWLADGFDRLTQYGICTAIDIAKIYEQTDLTGMYEDVAACA